MTKCEICGDVAEIRMGACFRCADVESVIEDGTNMWGKKVASTSMDKLKYIIEKYHINKHCKNDGLPEGEE